MTLLTLHDRDGLPLQAPCTGAEARKLLWQLGIRSGRWALQTRPVSATPLLTYARERLQLQREFCSALTDRVQLRPGPQRGDLREQHSVAWPEPPLQHTHEEPEVRVLLDGAARYVLRAPALGGWATLQLQPGDWLALPAGLSHSFQAHATHGAELLRLFARPGGWAMQRAALQAPELLAAWPEEALALAA